MGQGIRKHARWIPWVVGAAALITACEPTSGVNQNKVVHTLTTGDKWAICEYRMQISGGERMVYPCDGRPVENGTVIDCVLKFQDVHSKCDIMVSELEGCFEASAVDRCVPRQDLSECRGYTRCLTQ